MSTATACLNRLKTTIILNVIGVSHPVQVAVTASITTAIKAVEDK
jgi:hypothetical protein